MSRAREGLRALGWDLAETPVPIIGLGGRKGIDLQRIQQGLLARDICIAYVPKYSDTPVGGVLRIAINAGHTSAQIDRLVEEVRALL